MDSWDVSAVFNPNVPEDPGLETFLWYIYRKSLFTDVEFELGTLEEPITFSAHKMVLALWSPKFQDMFYKGQEQNLVCLKGVNPQGFRDLLRFMYGCDPKLGSHNDACNLYKVAKEFGVESLISLCQKYLLHVNIEVNNVFDVLETAECMQNERLIKHCLNLIQSETKTIINSYKYSDFSPSMIEVLLNSPKLSLDSEFDLILWIFSWAKTRFVEHHFYSSPREVLENFLPCLDFLALSNTEFATICKQYEDFFSEDEALRVFMNIGILNSRPMPAWYDTNAKRRIYTGKNL